MSATTTNNVNAKPTTDDIFITTSPLETISAQSGLVKGTPLNDFRSSPPPSPFPSWGETALTTRVPVMMSASVSFVRAVLFLSKLSEGPRALFPKHNAVHNMPVPGRGVDGFSFQCSTTRDCATQFLNFATPLHLIGGKSSSRRRSVLVASMIMLCSRSFSPYPIGTSLSGPHRMRWPRRLRTPPSFSCCFLAISGCSYQGCVRIGKARKEHCKKT